MTRDMLRHRLIEQLQLISSSPQIEADTLLMQVLNISRAELFAWGDKIVSAEDESKILELLTQRKNGQPLAYLLGSCEFWSLNFRTTPDTLIPRPDTELLVETILTKYQNIEQLTVADLGTGTGVIAISLAHEKPSWNIHATDASAAALHIAQENAARLHCKNIRFHLSDWFETLPTMLFDVIVSNPPYIAESDPHLLNLTAEPNGALVSGKDGLDDLFKICQGAKRFLKPTGLLLVEHGCDQGDQVRELFYQNKYSHVSTLKDLSGLDRATLGSN